MIKPTEKATIHTNPDGEKITGTHLHIYREECGEKFAMPFDIENKDLFDLCKTFFTRFNIIEPPTVTLQTVTVEV